jgi:hypothetical protein
VQFPSPRQAPRESITMLLEHCFIEPCLGIHIRLN